MPRRRPPRVAERMPEYPVHEMTIDALTAEFAFFADYHPEHGSDDDWYKLDREHTVLLELKRRFSAARNADPGMSQAELERWRDRLREDDRWIQFQQYHMNKHLRGATVLTMPETVA